MPRMEPIAAPLVTYRGLGLGDLVRVVGEYVVNSARMDIKILAQIFEAYAIISHITYRIQSVMTVAI